MNLFNQALFLPVIDLAHRAQQTWAIVAIERGRLESPDVFGKTGATETAPGINKMMADARICSNTLSHLFNIGIDYLGDIGNLVNKTDFRRQHGVCRVLGQLCRTHIHKHHAVVITIKGRVQLTHTLNRLSVPGTHDDAIRFHKIVDRSAFL